MRFLQWTLIGLLALGALGHLVGTATGYVVGSEVFVWSLTAVAFVFLIVFLQALRLTRPHDRAIKIGATLATSVWLALALAFGNAVGNVFDFRVVMHAAVSAALVATALLPTDRGLRAGRRGN